MTKSTRNLPVGHVYFIQVGEDGPIKIGWADSPGYRLAALQTANPMQLHLRLLIRTKNRSAEGIMHGLFRRLWIRGEWFKPHPGLMDYIAKMRDGAHRLIDVDGVKVPLVVETEFVIPEPDPIAWLNLLNVDRPSDLMLANVDGLTSKRKHGPDWS